MDESVFEVCSLRGLTHCMFHNPSLPVSTSKNCALRLYLDRSPERYCRVMISTKVDLPIGRYLGDSKWAIVSREPQSFRKEENKSRDPFPHTTD